MTLLWISQDVSIADACLVQPVLVIVHDKLVANLHPTIPLLIREAKCLAKMQIDLPIVATTLLCKQNHFDTIQDSMNVSVGFYLCVHTIASPISIAGFDKVILSRDKIGYSRGSPAISSPARSIDDNAEARIKANKCEFLKMPGRVFF